MVLRWSVIGGSLPVVQTGASEKDFRPEVPLSVHAPNVVVASCTATNSCWNWACGVVVSWRSRPQLQRQACRREHQFQIPYPDARGIQCVFGNGQRSAEQPSVYCVSSSKLVALAVRLVRALSRKYGRANCQSLISRSRSAGSTRAVCSGFYAILFRMTFQT